MNCQGILVPEDNEDLTQLEEKVIYARLCEKRNSLVYDKIIQLYTNLISTLNSESTVKIWTGTGYTTACEAFETARIAVKPYNNIDYWVHKVLDNSNWDYLVCMDWSVYDGL